MNDNLNQIGLDNNMARDLAGKLNVLLANYQVFYMNARGFHWNITGNKFFELHIKFEELYNDLVIKIDEIAERVLTLGVTPLHAYEDYLEYSNIKPVKNLSDDQGCVKSVLRSYAIILPLQRDILTVSGAAEDEGTNALMSDYIREQEKLVWMYNAYISED